MVPWAVAIVRVQLYTKEVKEVRTVNNRQGFGGVGVILELSMSSKISSL